MSDRVEFILTDMGRKHDPFNRDFSTRLQRLLTAALGMGMKAAWRPVAGPVRPPGTPTRARGRHFTHKSDCCTRVTSTPTAGINRQENRDER